MFRQKLAKDAQLPIPAIHLSGSVLDALASVTAVANVKAKVSPECGVIGLRPNRQSGLCPRCTELMHLNEEIAFNEILQAEREAASNEEAITGIRRERDKMRQRNSRLCRKYGLKGRRSRDGDIG